MSVECLSEMDKKYYSHRFQKNTNLISKKKRWKVNLNSLSFSDEGTFDK